MVLSLKDTADFKIPTKNIVDNDANFNYSTIDSINAYDRTYLSIVNANRSFFFPPANVLIERSTDGGSTWTTVSTSDYSNENRGKMFSDVGASGLTIGTGNAALTQQLRVTMKSPGSGWYCSLDRAYLRWSNSGHTTSVTIQASTYGAQSTYTNLVNETVISGWSGNDMYKFTRRTAWGTNNSNHLYNIRFIFKYTAINSSYPTNQANLIKINMYGADFWGTSGTPRYAGHLYNWDYLQNVTFPARLTAQSFKASGNGYPHVGGNTILTLSGTGAWAAGAGAIVLGAGEFRPAGSEDTNINLGTSGARWKNLFLSGNISNGTYSYTLPSATGTLALTSNIPTVNNATLTIQKNSTNVATFTANASSNVTADITVPTSFSDLSGTISNSQLDWSTMCAPVAETKTTTMAISYTKFYRVQVYVRSIFGGHGFEMGGMLDFGGSSGSATINKTAVTGLSGYYGYKTNATVPIAPNATMLYEWSGIYNNWTPGAANGGDRWYGNDPTGFAVDTDGVIWLDVNTSSTRSIGSWERQNMRYATAAHFIDH